MLRRIQAGAALLWVIYGVAIDAAPVIVANLIVAAAALYSSFGSVARRVPAAPSRRRRARYPPQMANHAARAAFRGARALRDMVAPLGDWMESVRKNPLRGAGREGDSPGSIDVR